MEIDPAIQDLSQKLLKLNFSTYRLLGTNREVVGMKKKEVLHLVDGYMLTVRPLYIEDKRVGMWLKWQDRSGLVILDTRMHFDPGSTMLAGTDRGDSSGLVLAIDVVPAE